MAPNRSFSDLSLGFVVFFGACTALVIGLIVWAVVIDAGHLIFWSGIVGTFMVVFLLIMVFSRIGGKSNR